MQADLIVLSQAGHVARLPLYQLIDESIPNTVPLSAKLLIAAYIPSVSRTTLTDYQNRGEYDDRVRRLLVLTEPFQSGETLEDLTITIDWNDQGWGNLKGELFLTLVAPTPAQGNRFMRMGGCDRRTKEYDHDVFRYTKEQLREQIGDDLVNCRLELLILIGNGGGHSIKIRSLEAVLTRSYAQLSVAQYRALRAKSSPAVMRVGQAVDCTIAQERCEEHVWKHIGTSTHYESSPSTAFTDAVTKDSAVAYSQCHRHRAFHKDCNDDVGVAARELIATVTGKVFDVPASVEKSHYRACDW
jgi:hypothetical protein